MAFQIHILQSNIIYGFLTGNNIGNLIHPGHKCLQILRRNTQRQVGTAASDTVFIIGIKLFYIPVKSLYLILNGSYQSAVIFRFHSHVYIFDEFSAMCSRIINLNRTTFSAGGLFRGSFPIISIVGIYAAGIIGGGRFRNRRVLVRSRLGAASAARQHHSQQAEADK